MGEEEKEKIRKELEKRIGGPQICPKCGSSNPSGKKLPEQCIICNPK